MPEFQAIQTRKSLQKWLLEEQYQRYVALSQQRVGMTKRRAECFVRLWLYLFLKDSWMYQSVNRFLALDMKLVPSMQ